MYALKRKLISAEDAIHKFNMLKSAKSIIVDREKLFSNESRRVKMSELLSKISSKVKVSSKGRSFVEYTLKRPGGKEFSIVRLKNLNFETLFSKENFMANLNHVFDCEVKEENFKINLFSKLNYKIEIDIPRSESKINVHNEDKSEFMFLVCMFFGMLFNIAIDNCICHPSSYEDFLLLNAGITKNCISNDCSTIILGNPLLFDPLVHYDCSQKTNSNILNLGLCLQSPIVSVNVTSTQIIEEKN